MDKYMHVDRSDLLVGNILTDHCSGPDSVTSPLYECVQAATLDWNDPWPGYGKVQRSRSYTKVHGRRRKNMPSWLKTESEIGRGQ